MGQYLGCVAIQNLVVGQRGDTRPQLLRRRAQDAEDAEQLVNFGVTGEQGTPAK